MIKILKYGEVENSDIFARAVPEVNVEDIVTDIIKNVRKNGDKALFEYCEKFDKAKLSALEVTEEEIEEAFNSVEPKFIEEQTLSVTAKASGIDSSKILSPGVIPF